MMSDTGTSAVICNIRYETATDAPNLQRPVYDVDVAVAVTQRKSTRAHSVRESVIKCLCMEAPLCGEHTSSRSLGTRPSG